MLAETQVEKRVIVKCISAYKDTERSRLIVPPTRLSVTKERAKTLVEANVCIEIKK